MPNFWHFGDSFAFNNFKNLEKQENNFGSFIAKKLNLNYNFEAVTGSSNELIFSKILTMMNHYEKNDILFINWSFFSRSCYCDGLKIKSTNQWYDDNNQKLNNYDLTTETLDFFKNHSLVMDYVLDYNFDVSHKLFSLYIEPFLRNLEESGIRIYNLFLKEYDVLKYNGIEVNDYSIPLKKIKFNQNYYDWLIEKKWMTDEEGHYKKGIQKQLADEIMLRMNLEKENI